MATAKAIRNLPLVQVEVLATTREEMLLRETNANLLCHLVLDWIQRNWDPSLLNFDQLIAKVKKFNQKPRNNVQKLEKNLLKMTTKIQNFIKHPKI